LLSAWLVFLIQPMLGRMILPKLGGAASVWITVSLFFQIALLAGYLYGGIRAFPREFPYRDDSPAYHSGNVPTRSSDMIVAVYITVPPTN